MGISCGFLKSLGFTEHDPPKEIIGTCYIVRIYQINGIMKFDNDEQMIDSFNENAKFGIGNNISEICDKLIGIKADNTDKYAKKNGFPPPFLVTVTTDNKIHQDSCRWIKECNEIIEVYNCSKKRINNKERFLYAFQYEEEQIKNLLDEYEILYLPAVTCSFSSSDNPVTVKKIKEIILWATPDGIFFTSFRIQLDAEGQQIAKVVLSDERKENLIALIEKSRLLNSTTSKLLFRSMQEDDKIIKFLFSWTALEKLINKTFKDTPEKPSEFPPVDEIPVEYKNIVSSRLYRDPTRERKFNSVGQKFVYLSIYYWDFSSEIYDRFQAVKKIRDDFVHHKREVNEHEFVMPSIDILNIINEIINADFVDSTDSCETAP